MQTFQTYFSPEQDVMVELLPPKFNEETELRFTAKKGKNENNWDLESK